jgi:site-specific recombinase XerD
MFGRGNRPTTVNTRVGDIRAWCEWMTHPSRRYIAENPARWIERAKVPEQAKEALSMAQFEALLDVCHRPDLVGARRYAMLMLFWTTGMRRNELWGLTRDDLKWEDAAIHIRNGKGQTERFTCFVPEAQSALEHYLLLRADHADHLWVSDKFGVKQLSYYGVYQDMERIFEYAGIKVKDYCHIFRRSCACNMEKMGIPRRRIRALMGWKSDAMPDHYTKSMNALVDIEQDMRDYMDYCRRNR